MNSIFGQFLEVMNTSVLLQSKWSQLPEVYMFHERTKNWIYCLYLHCIINIESNFNLGKNSFVFQYNRMKGFVGV